jgi:mevalonate kinase
VRLNKLRRCDVRQQVEQLLEKREKLTKKIFTKIFKILQIIISMLLTRRTNIFIFEKLREIAARAHAHLDRVDDGIVEREKLTMDHTLEVGDHSGKVALHPAEAHQHVGDPLGEGARRLVFDVTASGRIGGGK